MKKIVYSIVIFTASCTNHATFDKDACVADKELQTIYKDSLQSYCNCVEEHMQQTADTIHMNDSILEAYKQSCANEFTTLDTNF